MSDRPSSFAPSEPSIAADERTIDIAVIGLGSAGEAVASELAEAGRSVVGFEPHRVGGECPFVACMPSKALLHQAHRLDARADRRALWPTAIEHREKVVNGRDDAEHVQHLEQAGVTVIRSAARLVGAHQVEADGTVWRADHVVVATGSAPVIPPVEGLDRSRIWTAFEALASPDLPNRIAIVGAGPVGCELADVYRSFGSEVLLVDRSDRLLGDHDAAVAGHFEQALRDQGIEVQLGSDVDRVDHGADTHRLTITDGAGVTETVTVDQILVAAGQAPRLDGLGLEAIGLDPSAPLELDEMRRVPGHLWLSMIGDVNDQTPWTHGANRDATILAGSILGSPWSTTSAAMPRATFTNPPAAHVGQAATDDNGLLRGVGSYADVARFSTDGLDDGLVVVAVDPNTGLVVGCSAVGPLADELIATATSLVHFEIPVDRARTQVFAFPTISQVLEVAIADAAEQFARNRTA